MGETAHIPVAETSDGPGGSGPPGQEVSLPVVELLTGRGFITGKSGAGKSNSASVVVEKLLDSGFGLLIVDVDGEYYGLKEEYEILHVGADDECDIQVTTEHAGKLASLALEQNVPIILDVSSYLDESEAEELLTAVARSLFARARKQKQPFLLLVEEVHEYIPEQGSVGDCGQMLIKIGKRGRKHGLGICGISQRPADVKKDFITQCDWLLWHRLTWKNDTQVVRRILDSEYADAVENLGDGEGFLVTDWSGDVRRVQFYRKQTFDAGATPGLEEFERPALKSVSEDLVSELATISEEATEREDRIAELRAQLDEKNARIAELERELQDARDLRDLAEQFVTALTLQGEQAGRTEREIGRQRSGRSTPEWPGGWRTDEADHLPNRADDRVTENAEMAGESDPADEQPVAAGTTGEPAATPESTATGTDAVTDNRDSGPNGTDAVTATPDSAAARELPASHDAETNTSEKMGDSTESTTNTSEKMGERNESPRKPTDTMDQDTSDSTAEQTDGEFDAEELLSKVRNAPDRPFHSVRSRPTREEMEQQLSEDTAVGTDDGTGDEPSVLEVATGRVEQPPTRPGDASPDSIGESLPETEKSATADGSITAGEPATADDAVTTGEPATADEAAPTGEFATADEVLSTDEAMMPAEEPRAVRELKADIDGLETKTRRMLAFYREHGPASAQNAHFAAGGDGDRTHAYARNRTLRTRGLIEHVGRGRYDYCLDDQLVAELGDHVDEAVVERLCAEIEASALDS